MLAKKYRLASYLIPQTLKKGKRFYSKHFILITNFRLSTANNQPRFSFIVSKKVYKLAVRRNRLKRRLREIARQNLSKIKNGYNIIILARKIQMWNYHINIKDEIEKLFKQAELVK